MLRPFVLAAPIALAGCLGPAEFRGWPEPQHSFSGCSNEPAGIAACHERARAACPEGYQLAEERSDPAIQRYMIVVRCGPATVPAVEPPARRSAPPATPK